MKRELVAEIILSMEEDIPDPAMEKAIELSKSDMFEGATAEEIVNIIKNLADKPIDIDPEEYQDMVKEELIKSGMLNEKNFIDEQKMAEEAGKEEIPIPTDEVKPQVTEKKNKPEEKGTFRGRQEFTMNLLAGITYICLYPSTSVRVRGRLRWL
ncbi:MAG: hypothetical protein MZV63_13800 [Marinilabiliales bacterium]|nr:hypothetical protein [Marinilabiliales bacterium]